MSAGLVFLDLRLEPLEVGRLAHHVLVLSREQHLRVRIFFQHRGKRLEQDLDSLFGREARRHADDGTAGRRFVGGRERFGRAPGRSWQFNRGQDRGQFVPESRQVRGVIGVVLGVGHNMIRQNPRHVVLEVDDQVDEAVKESGRQVEVAVIGEDRGLAEETGAQGHAGRVELREMQLDDIVARDQFSGDPPKSRGEHALADAERDRDAENLHAVERLFARQELVILRGHHGDLMSAARERAGETLRINGESRSVRAIVGENGQDFHRAGGL